MIKVKDRSAIRRLLMKWGSAKRRSGSIDARINELKELIASITDVHPAPLTGMPSSNSIGDPTSQAAAKLDKARRDSIAAVTQILDAINRDVAFIAFIDDVLDEFPSDQKTVIELRYKRYGTARTAPWVKIAVRMEKSENAVQKLEQRAVDRMAKYVGIKKL